jgi:hypothetical protein
MLNAKARTSFLVGVLLMVIRYNRRAARGVKELPHQCKGAAHTFGGRLNKITLFGLEVEHEGAYKVVGGSVQQYRQHILVHLQRSMKHCIDGYDNWYDFVSSFKNEVNNWLKPRITVAWGQERYSTLKLNEFGLYEGKVEGSPRR